MAFKFYSGPKRYESIGCLGSAAIVKDTLVRFDAGTGYLEPAVGSSVNIYGVAQETATASATNGATKVLVIPLQGGQVWLADCSTTPAQTVVGTEVDTEGSAASPSQIDEDSSSEDIFEVVAILGAAADKKLLVTPNIEVITAIGE